MQCGGGSEVHAGRACGHSASSHCWGGAGPADAQGRFTLLGVGVGVGVGVGGERGAWGGACRHSGPVHTAVCRSQHDTRKQLFSN